MAPVAQRYEKENRLNTTLGEPRALQRWRRRANLQIAGFATNLEKSLRSNDIPTTLITQLYKQLDRWSLTHDADAAPRCRELDEHGTKLWNLASRHKRDSSISTELGCLGMPFHERTLIQHSLKGTVRVFACLLLDWAQRCTPVSQLSKALRDEKGRIPRSENALR